MGEISRKLHGKLKAMSSGRALPTSSKGRKPTAGTPDILKLIAEGMDLELMKAGQRIQAIKLYRQQTGAGLKQAKDYVESL